MGPKLAKAATLVGIVATLATALGATACKEVAARSEPDAPLPPPPPQPVAVQVLNDIDGQPLEGMTVLVHDATGAYVANAVTDDQGQVTFAEVPDQASVTIIRAYGLDHSLTTIFGVEPGDHLVLGRRANPNYVYTGSMTVLLPDAPHPDINQYILYTRCDESDLGNTRQGAIDFFEHCQDGSFEVFALALDWPIRSYGLSSSGHTFVANGTIDLTDAQWLPTYSFFVAITQLPQVFNYISATWRATEDDWAVGFGYDIDDLDNNPTSVTMDVRAQTGGDGSVVEIELHRADASDQIISERRSTTRYDNSYPTMALPMLSWPAFDFDTQTMSWTEDVPGAPADAFRAILNWSTGPEGDRGYHNWVFIGPPTANSFKVPSIPAEFGELRPTYDAASDNTCNQTGCPHIELIETSGHDGYADIRQELDSNYWRYLDTDNNPYGLPTEQRIRISGMFLDLIEVHP